MKSLGRKSQGARLERIKASPRWSDEQFRNVYPIIPGLRDPNATMPSISEFICGGERRVPRGRLPSLNPLSTWSTTATSGLRATWLGHSTVFIEIDGARVLTDPSGDPARRRRHSPARSVSNPCQCRLRSMPPMDLVIVSHDHYDHLDYPTIRELAEGTFRS